MIGRLVNVFRVPDLRSRLWVTLLFLLVYRVGMNIPLPGTDMGELRRVLHERDEGEFLNLVNMLSGGGIAGCALFSMGIMPYISASIIFSLLVKVIPSLETIAKEGSAGQRKINQWTRYATVPLAFIQAWIVMRGVYQTQFHMGGAIGTVQLIPSGFFVGLGGVLALTAGTILLMWIGEQITEHGVGNGISLLIMAGIIARLPENIRQLIQDHPSPLTPVLLAVVFVSVVVVVVYITKGTRRIPVQYAKLVRERGAYDG